MAVGSIALTEGSGAKTLHTWQRTVSSVNREEEYVQIAEPALPTFVVAYSAATTTTAAHAMQVMAGSTNYVRILRIGVYIEDTPTDAGLLALDLFRLTTAGTGGTTLNPAPMDTADTATATAMTLPSSKGTEGAWLGRINVPMSVAVAASEGTRIWEPPARGKPLIIPAGTSNGLAIKVFSGVPSSGVFITVWWTETAWL